jgi:long-chain acyl-CoA synthetase
VHDSVRRHPDKTALLPGTTYRDLWQQIREVGHGLAALGVQQGEKIAILSYNRPEWPVCDLAVLALRGVSVPVYHTLPSNQVEHVLRDAGVSAVWVEDAGQLEKVEEVTASCPTLRLLLSFEPVQRPDGAPLSFSQVREIGRDHLREHPDWLEQRMDSIDPDELCSLVYTSGTTGNPKGVMLNHRGFVADVVSAENVFGLREDDVFLSCLPLSHLYERVAGHWCALRRGCTIGYARSLSSVMEDLQRVRPTVMVGVPRLYEKIATAIVERAESGSRLSRTMFRRAMNAGGRKHPLADLLVLRKIRRVFGGRLRCSISGGAPLSPETLRFFTAIGTEMVEGYGMTEAHLIVALTPPGVTRPGSCGKPLPGIEVRVAEDGEILVRGDTVMAGYYNQEQLSREAVDGDGWLHTGDVGHLDQDGFLFITDRKKNIIVTAGGKNIAPAPIENELRSSRYVEDVCLIGDRRKFVSALIVPDFDALDAWVQSRGIGSLDRHHLARHPDVEKLLMQEIQERQSGRARFEQVKRCLLLDEPLSVQGGELTPTLKIKRRVVEQRFRERIDGLYREPLEVTDGSGCSGGRLQ